jgi:hypothetical protein
MPSPVAKGLTTVHWGTFNTTNVTNAIVTRLAITPKNGDPIEIEDENGFTKTLVILNDGWNGSATILAQTANLTLPNVGDTVMVHLPHLGANINTTYVATPEIDLERKREGTVTLRLVYRPGINT